MRFCKNGILLYIKASAASVFLYFRKRRDNWCVGNDKLYIECIQRKIMVEQNCYMMAYVSHCATILIRNNYGY